MKERVNGCHHVWRDTRLCSGRRYTDKPAQARHGWFARFMEALSESRRRQALREIQKHAHLLPYTLVEPGNRLVKTGNGDMPFGV